MAKKPKRKTSRKKQSVAKNRRAPTIAKKRIAGDKSKRKTRSTAKRRAKPAKSARPKRSALPANLHSLNLHRLGWPYAPWGTPPRLQGAWPKHDWGQVDWSKTNAQIANKLKCSQERVRQVRMLLKKPRVPAIRGRKSGK